MQTIAQQLQHARTVLAPVAGDLAPLEARLLAQHAWGMTPEVLVGRTNDIADAAPLQMALERRLAHEPIAQIIGKKHFWKNEFFVSRHVLTPRADSETIIEACLRLAGLAWPTTMRILDLGTGSGCLLLSLLGEYGSATGVGIDQSAEALAVATKNAQALGLESRSEFLCGNWCEGLETGAQFDMVVANPPYIAHADIAALQADVREHEPMLALDGGDDGLDAYRAILSQLATQLNEKAVAVFEVGAGQADDVAALAQAAGFTCTGKAKDLAGIDRVVTLQKTNGT